MFSRKLSLRVLSGLAALAVATALMPATSVAAPPPAPSYACSSGASPRSGAVKIMIAGDSITNASAGDYTWRYWLWQNLHGKGAKVDFVGRFKDTLVAETLIRGNRQYLDCNFDLDHEARPGLKLYSADSSKASYTRPFTSKDPYQPSYPGQTSWIRGAVAKYKPSLLVAFAGVNDVAFPSIQGTKQQVAAKAIQFLKTFINQSRLGNPGVDIVLTTVPTPGSGETKYTLYNKALPKVVSSMSTKASKLVVATLPEWNATQSWDGVHPNAVGEVGIAATIAGALKKLNPALPGRPAKLQKPKIGPRVKPVLTATAGNTGSRTINLSWTLPPGGNRTIVYIRNASANGPWLQRADLVLSWQKQSFPKSNQTSCGTSPCRTLAVTGLSAGTRYEFRVRSAKGLAVASDIVSVAKAVTAR